MVSMSATEIAKLKMEMATHLVTLIFNACDCDIVNIAMSRNCSCQSRENGKSLKIHLDGE